MQAVICPECGACIANDAQSCRNSECGISLSWLSGVPEFRRTLQADHPQTTLRPISDDGEELSSTRLEPIPLKRKEEIFGSGKAVTSPIRGRIMPRHAVLATPTPRGSSWISRATPDAFLSRNGIPIVVARLEHGDFVQIGDTGWIFNQVGPTLDPAPGIRGLSLELNEIPFHPEAPPITTTIRPGEFLVIRGRSGIGKSTLLKYLAGLWTLPPGKSICLRATEFNGSRASVRSLDVRLESSLYRRQIGYVAQSNVLHADLTPRQALGLAAALREVELSQSALLQHLSRFELGEYELGRRRISHLSGGELRRLNTACEIVAEPKLLFVDEPDSGLDRNNRVRLMRILKGLSLQGCTVVMVTHSDDGLELADRFWELDRSGLVFDGNWREYALRHQLPTTPARSGVLRPDESPRANPRTTPDEPTPSSPRVLSAPLRPPVSSSSIQREWNRSFRRRTGTSQLAALWKREWALIRAQWIPKLIGILGVAAMFAGTLGFSLPAERPYLLVFLAIISVIWMGSTLSLLSICGEREIYDHEQSLFLRTDRYLLAKAGVLGILSTLQTSVFVGILTAIRAGLLLQSDQAARLEIERRLLFQDGLPVFLITGWCGVLLGLLLSALVGPRKELANRILPTVILLQIVCSVPIARNPDIDRSVVKAYRDFGVRQLELEQVPGWLSYLTISRPAEWSLRAVGYDGTEQRRNSTTSAARRVTLIEMALVWILLMGILTWGVLQTPLQAWPGIYWNGFRKWCVALYLRWRVGQQAQVHPPAPPAGNG